MRYASTLGVIAMMATFAASVLAQDPAPKIAKPDLPEIVSGPTTAGATDVPTVVQALPITASKPAQAPPDPQVVKPAPSSPGKAVLPVSVIPDELKSQVSIAAQHVRSNELAQALAIYTEVLKTNADLFTIAFERGKIYQQMKDHAKAIADFGSAIDKSPEHYEAYFARCVSYHHTGAFAQAVPDCGKAIQLNPTRPDYYYYRGLAYMSLRTWDKAATDLAAAADINPEETEVHLMLAKAYSEMDQLIHALREYTIVVQQKPGHADAYKGRSTIKALLGDTAGSQDDLKKIAR